MDLKRFKEIVESYGACEQRWPSAERAAALNLLASSAEAELLQAEAGIADTLLASQPQPDPADEELLARLVAISDDAAKKAPERMPKTPKASGGFSLGGLVPDFGIGFGLARSLLPQASAVVMAGFLGVYLGLSSAAAYDQPIEIDAGAFLLNNPSLEADLEELD